MKKVYLIIGLVILITLVVVITLIGGNKTTSVAVVKMYQQSELFTTKDLEQSVDTTDATKYNVSDGENITINSAGVYVISGTAKNVTVYIEAGDQDKVQIILDSVNIINESMPCIYVKTADKAFINLKGNNTLKVTGTLGTDGTSNLDGVIFSKEDITFNGTGTLNIESSQNGITGKDDVKITGGTYNINAQAVAVRANDSIRIAGGNININGGTDGLHAENSTDDKKGYVFISGGSIEINAIDDCIHGGSVVEIDDGNITLNGAEGIEGTYVQINGGTLKINATGDGINAGSKSESYKVTIEITGGNINIVMADGDTDGIDSNGDIIISGGNIDVTGSGAFDYDGTANFTGGTVIINGEKVDTIPNSLQ